MERKFKKTVEIEKSFSKRSWNALPEDEKVEWRPVDEGWSEENRPKLSTDEKWKMINETRKRKQMEDLRLKEGTSYPVADGKIKLVRWGARCHLIIHTNNWGVENYATMSRKVRDTSWGLQDSMDFYADYQAYPSKEEAEQAYIRANGN